MPTPQIVASPDSFQAPLTAVRPNEGDASQVGSAVAQAGQVGQSLSLNYLDRMNRQEADNYIETKNAQQVDKWTQTIAAAKMDGSAADPKFYQNTMKAVDDSIAADKAAAPSPMAAREYGLRMIRLRNGIHEDALTAQRDGQIGQQVDNLGSIQQFSANTVATKPSDFQAVLQNWNDSVGKSTFIPPAQREKLRQDGAQKIARSALDTTIDNDPRGGLAQLTSGAWDKYVTPEVRLSYENTAHAQIRQEDYQARIERNQALQAAKIDAGIALQDEMAAAPMGGKAVDPRYQDKVFAAFGPVEGQRKIAQVEHMREVGNATNEMALKDKPAIMATLATYAQKLQQPGGGSWAQAVGFLSRQAAARIHDIDAQNSQDAALALPTEEERAKQGLPPTPGAMDKLSAGLGAGAPSKITELNATREGAAFANGPLQQLASSDIKALDSNLTPQDAEHARQATIVHAAATAALAEREKTPALAVLHHFPDVAAGYNSGDPAQIATSIRKSLDIQTRVFQLDPDERQALPPTAVKTIMDGFNKAPTGDAALGTLAPLFKGADEPTAQAITAQLKKDGGLSDTALLGLQAYVGGDQARASQLMDIAKVDPKTLPAPDPDSVKARDTTTAIAGLYTAENSPAAVDMKAYALTGNAGAGKGVALNSAAIQQATKTYVAQGMAPADAVAKANDLVYGKGNSVVDVDQLAHVHLPAGTDPDAAEAGFTALRASIDLSHYVPSWDQFDPAKSGKSLGEATGLSNIATREAQAFIGDLRTNGTFVNAPGGYVMIDPVTRRAVADKDGAAHVFSLGDVLGAAGDRGSSSLIPSAEAAPAAAP